MKIGIEKIEIILLDIAIGLKNGEKNYIEL